MFRRPVTLRRINALLMVGYLAWMGLPPAAAAKQLWILSGTVLDGLGRPLAGARVSLADLPTSAEQGRRGVEGAAMDQRLQVATDSAGRFAVEIGTPTLLTVTVSAAGFLAMRLGPFAETRSVELPPLVLSRSEIASVLLVDSAGEPVSGRRVAARSSVKSAAAPGWRPAPRHYRSDRRGEILLQRRPGEELELQLTDRALASYELPAAQDPAVLEVRAAERRERLAVTAAAGEAMPNVVVWAEGWEQPLAISDAAGLVSLPDLGTAPEQPLWLQAPDGSSSALVITVSQLGSGLHRLRIPHRQSVHGQVLAIAGETPVAGALVWAGVDPGRWVLTDREGRFELAHLAGVPTFVQAQASGFVPGRIWPLKSAAGEPTRLSLPAAGPVLGRVLDATGGEVAGVAVSARESERATTFYRTDSAAARTLSEADGRFSLEGLAEGRTYELLAEHRTLGTAALSWTVGAAGEPRLRLTALATLTGRVLDSDGAPVAAVAVSVWPSREERGARTWTAESSPAGEVLVEGLPPGLCEVELRSSGYAPVRLQRVRIVAGKNTALGDLVLPQGASVAVRVTTLVNLPVAGARVQLLVPVEEWREKLLRQALTGEDGTLRFDDLGRDRVLRLRVAKEGYLDQHFTAVRAGGSAIEVVLRPAAAIRGRVTSGDGEPVAGARVAMAHSEPLPATGGRAMRSGPRLEGTETDPEGFYEVLGIPAGELRIWIRAAGYVSPQERRLTIAEGAVVEDVDYQLSAGAVVTGEVIDSDGQPVPRSHVQVADAGTSADAQGQYRVAGVPTGEQTAIAKHPDYGEIQQEIEVGEGENTLTLTLEKGQEVLGEAVDAAGRLLSGAYVTLRVPASGGRFYSTSSDSGGRFSFPSVDDGEYQLEGQLVGLADARLEAPVVVPDTDGSALQLIFDRGVRVHGRVLGLEPTELSGVRIEAETGAGRAKSGTVDFDGNFEVQNLAPGRWLLRATRGDGARHTQARLLLGAGDSDIERDLEFERRLNLDGQVIRGEDGLAAVDVTLQGNRLAVARRVVTDQDGRFEIEDLRPGAYLLSLRHGHERLVHNEEILLDADRTMTIDLETGSLSGAVVESQSGTPLSAALLALRRVVTRPREFPFLVTHGSHEDGSFFIPRVPAGHYQLTVHKEGFAEHSAQIEVVAGQELEDLRIELAATRGLQLLVRAVGGPPAWLSARLTHATTGQVLQQSRALDSQGRCQLATVPAGEWQVAIGAPGASLTTITASVPGPPVEVQLIPGSRLEVSVEDLASSDQLAALVVVGADGRRVETLAEGGALRDAWKIRAGVGVIDGLPPGLWTVEARSPDGRSWMATVLAQGEPRIKVALH